jgi:GNAT superfamily N-acetyltransferase
MPFLTIQRVLEPPEGDRKMIVKPLLAYNLAKAGDENYKQLALFLRDNENEVQGGLWAKIYYDWLFVDLLFVPEAMRGENLGSTLLREAEDWAKSAGCRGAWLDTFAFQAPEFYKKQGYTVFGTLENYPEPHSRHFLRKIF